MSLFDHCSKCKSCCHVDKGAPPLEVNLTAVEQLSMQPICIESRCRHLRDAGCSLGKSKPFGCDLYPLAYDPGEHQFYFDRECPLFDTYVEQLADAKTEASQHLSRMQKAVKRLERIDRGYLQQNFAFDRDYFDLAPLGRASD